MADGSDVERTLADLDELLGRLEQLPGPAGELALEAVSALAEVYGAALARAVAIAVAQGNGATAAAFTADPLLGSLLALHGIHPDAAEVRVARALDELPGGIEFLGITDGVADVQMSGGGCGCGSSAGAEAVRDAVLAAAPELADVRTVAAQAARAPAFVPLASLSRARVPVPGGR
jgi:Fe-S cluster biogenesis protein NfuA